MVCADLQYLMSIESGVVDLKFHEPHEFALQFVTEGLKVLGDCGNVVDQVAIGGVIVNHPLIVGFSSADHWALGHVSRVGWVHALYVSVQQEREEELADVEGHLLLPAAQEFDHQILNAVFISVDKLPDL